MEHGRLLDSLIVAKGSLLSRRLEGEMALFDPVSKQCYSLNPVGSRVWDLIQEPKAVGAVVRLLAGEYRVELQDCERSVLALIEDLLDSGLIDLKAATEISAGEENVR
jgi:hypothetical protein